MRYRRVSPLIISGILAGGIGLSMYLTSKNTRKAIRIIDEAEEKRGEELTSKEKIKISYKCFIPSVSVGTATIIFAIGTNLMNNKQQLSTVAAYKLFKSYYSNYRKILIEKYGEEVDKDIKFEMARSNYAYHCIDLDIPDKKVYFYEAITNQYIMLYERDMIDAEYHFNRNYALACELTLNDFLHMVGMKEIADKNLGWSMNNDELSWIDFEHSKIGRKNGKDVYLICFIYPPDDMTRFD